MYWTYGAHTHPSNEANCLSFSKRRIHSSRGYRERELRTAVLRGVLLASTQSTIKDAIDELEAAYFQDGLDLVFYHDDGTESPHKMKSNDPLAISGVKIKSITYPEGRPEEYATGRTYQIVAEAEYDISEKEVLEFSEQISVQGACGPRWVALENFTGQPYVQVLAQRTVQRIIQKGYAISLDGYFAYPAPVLPNLEHSERSEETLVSPRRNRGRLTHYRTEWRYHFSSGIRQNVFPHTY